MQRIVTCLCFVDQAHEAVKFYQSVFKDVKITSTTHAGKDEVGGAEGSVRTVAFTLFGQEFLAVNGGEHFQFTDAMSLQVRCDGQLELDRVWAKLTSEGGQEVMCGWCRDKFGVSWQVLPAQLDTMMKDPDEKKSQAVMQAILGMVKLDIAALEKAYRSV